MLSLIQGGQENLAALLSLYRQGKHKNMAALIFLIHFLLRSVLQRRNNHATSTPLKKAVFISRIFVKSKTSVRYRTVA